MITNKNHDRQSNRDPPENINIIQISKGIGFVWGFGGTRELIEM